MRTREEDIIDAATSLFTKKGTLHTTVEEIAQESGLGKGTIYNYFPSKEAILLEVVRRQAKAIYQHFKSIHSIDEDVADVMRKFVIIRNRALRGFAQKYNITRDVYREVVQVNAQIFIVVSLEEQNIIKEILVKGLGEGMLETADLDLVTYSIYSLLFALDLKWIFDYSEEQVEHAAGVLVKMLIEGLRRRPRAE
jgi:AcrR family transcriptional regulator